VDLSGNQVVKILTIIVSPKFLTIKKSTLIFFIYKETLKDILNLKDNLKLIDPLGGH
jgi:hypothetical protein